jgi:hypothetical protein
MVYVCGILSDAPIYDVLIYDVPLTDVSLCL